MLITIIQNNNNYYYYSLYGHLTIYTGLPIWISGYSRKWRLDTLHWNYCNKANILKHTLPDPCTEKSEGRRRVPPLISIASTGRFPWQHVKKLERQSASPGDRTRPLPVWQRAGKIATAEEHSWGRSWSESLCRGMGDVWSEKVRRDFINGAYYICSDVTVGLFGAVLSDASKYMPLTG